MPLPTSEPSTKKSTEPVGVPNVAVTLANNVIGAFAAGLAGANATVVAVGEGFTASDTGGELDARKPELPAKLAATE